MLAITGFGVTVIPDEPWAFITPGVGSFTIGSTVYTLTSAGVAEANGAAIPGGSGTGRMASLGGQPYGQDAASGTWYLWNGSAWVAQALSTSGATVTVDTGWLIITGSIVVTLTSGGQIAFNGVTDTVTQGVALLLWYNGQLWQDTASYGWYEWTNPGWTSGTDPRLGGSGTPLLGAQVSFVEDSTWANNLATFVSAMGQSPAILNAFVDFPDWGTVQTQGTWTADDLAMAPNFLSYIPCVAIPMATTADSSADAAFRAIIAGAHDAAFTAIFNQYKSHGWTKIYIRPGWEFDGTWFPWQTTPAIAADYVAAFQHIAALAHAFSGMTIKVIWCVNGASQYTSAYWPGKPAVDIIGIDQFGYGMSGTANTQVTENDGVNWSFATAIAFAIAQGLPFCADELCDSIADSPSYTAALLPVLQTAGVVIDHITIVNEPTETLWATDPTASAAWKGLFAGISGGDPPSDPPSSGVFTSSGGKILGPNGQPFVFKGIAVMDAQIGSITPAQIVARHPKCNAIRLSIGNANHGFQTPANSWATTKAWIDEAVAIGIVVVLDDHEQNGGTAPYTGAALTADLAYVTNAATVYKNQPLVLFQSMNEPGTTAGLSAYHQAFNNAVRATGNQNLVFHDIIGGNLPQANALSDSKTPYESMPNWAWDFHFYNWMTQNALGANWTNQADVNAWYNSQVATLIAWAAQSGGSAPGAACVEWGWIDYSNGGNSNVNVYGGAGTSQIAMCALTQNTAAGQPSSGSFVWLFNGDCYGWGNTTELEIPIGTVLPYGAFWDANA